MSLGRRQEIGFTLVELMIVVAIISVLAVIAGTAYRKYMDSGRSAEAYSMLGEIRGKEEAYLAENSTYLGTDAVGDQLLPAATLVATTKSPRPRSTDHRHAPATWSAATGLGLSPTKTMLYCGYVVIAGAKNTAVTQTRGKPLFSNYTGSVPTVRVVVRHRLLRQRRRRQSGTNAYFADFIADIQCGGP